jgi:hypothetical protein
MTEKNKSFVITKKIAKHGSQSIIVIPRMLEKHLKPGMIVQLGIDVLADMDMEVGLEKVNEVNEIANELEEGK